MAKLFFSYSHKDEELRNELEVHLAALRRQGIIEPWHDRRIGPGENIDHSISEHLESADIILLLVSADFIASDYCYDVEVQREDGSTTEISMIGNQGVTGVSALLGVTEAPYRMEVHNLRPCHGTNLK